MKIYQIFLFYDSERGFTALSELGQSLYWSTAPENEDNFLDAEERLKRIFQGFKVVRPVKGDPDFHLSIERYKKIRATSKNQRGPLDLKDY